MIEQSFSELLDRVTHGRWDNAVLLYDLRARRHLLLLLVASVEFSRAHEPIEGATRKICKMLLLHRDSWKTS